MIVLSLGWGIQSFTLAAMVALGELDKIDVAIHSDTRHEKSSTYEFAARWTPWLVSRGVRVETVSAANTNFFDMPRLCSLGTPPLYSLDANGNRGQLNRSCTNRWKITPMRRWIQSYRNKASVTQLIGISLDEFHRMRSSDVKYITHRYPLVELRMTRQDCIVWLERHWLEVPPKSSCVFCPFHRRAAWHELKDNPADWEKSVLVDNAIRTAREPYRMYLHSDCIPLESIVSPRDAGQIEMQLDICDGGHCFL